MRLTADSIRESKIHTTTARTSNTANNISSARKIYYERDNRPDWDTLLPLNREINDSDMGMRIMVFNNYIEEKYGQ